MSRYRNYNRDPRIISAKFDSKCAETGKIIRKGEDCVYYPDGKSVYSMDSNQAESFRAWKFDIDYLGCDY